MAQSNCARFAEKYQEIMTLWTELVEKRAIKNRDSGITHLLLFLYREVLKKKLEWGALFGSYEFVDLLPLVRVESLEEEYSSGQQTQCLRDAFDVNWLILGKEQDYDGDWYAVFEREGKIHLLNGYFGSYDSLEDTDPREWLENNVKNVRAFDSKPQAAYWLKTTDEFSYTDIRNKVLIALGGTPDELEEDDKFDDES